MLEGYQYRYLFSAHGSDYYIGEEKLPDQFLSENYEEQLAERLSVCHGFRPIAVLSILCLLTYAIAGRFSFPDQFVFYYHHSEFLRRMIFCCVYGILAAELTEWAAVMISQLLHRQKKTILKGILFILGFLKNCLFFAAGLLSLYSFWYGHRSPLLTAALPAALTVMFLAVRFFYGRFRSSDERKKDTYSAVLILLAVSLIMGTSVNQRTAGSSQTDQDLSYYAENDYSEEDNPWLTKQYYCDPSSDTEEAVVTFKQERTADLVFDRILRQSAAAVSSDQSSAAFSLQSMTDPLSIENLPDPEEALKLFAHFKDENSDVYQISSDGSDVSAQKSFTMIRNGLSLILFTSGSDMSERLLAYHLDPDSVIREEMALDKDDLPYEYQDQVFVTESDILPVTRSEDVYRLFDLLTEQYGQYMTKQAFSEGSVTLYEYTLSSGDLNTITGSREPDGPIQKPVILITTGIHGYERSSVMSLYVLCRAMCEKHPALAEITDRYTVKVIPVVCPSGYDDDSRVNRNGVNINRNFASSSWQPADTGDDYSGSSAGSEDETRIIQAWLSANTNALVYIDWHNSYLSNEVSCLLGEQTEREMNFKREYLYAVNRIIPYWENKGWPANDIIFAYTGHTGTNGTAKSYGADLGILSFTLETSWDVGRTGKHGSLSINTGAEVMACILNAAAHLPRQQ
ncbi:MAG: hypothetical protein K6A40_10910 [Solobacterium sp.]|nr:hypothetical protein [Solobacterium sp.]